MDRISDLLDESTNQLGRFSFKSFKIRKYLIEIKSDSNM